MKVSVSVSVFSFFILCSFGEKLVPENIKMLPKLCTRTKIESSCLCKYITDGKSHITLSEIDCSRTGLDGVPDETQLPPVVHDMDLSHNNIIGLNHVQTKLRSLTLRSINISFNNIIHITEEFFVALPNLEEIDLSHNKLTAIHEHNVFFGLKKLKALNLSFNNLQSLPDMIFYPVPNLYDLNLSYNNLGALLMSSGNLFNSTLGLNRNISFLKLDSLGMFEISSNYFEGANNLQYLSLADNPLSEVPTFPDSITYLDLSGTKLKEIGNFKAYRFLKILKLNRLHKITEIYEFPFHNDQLESLSLDDCKKLKRINEIDPNVLTMNNSFKLKRVSFSRSGLRTLHSSFLRIFSMLDHLNLQYNQWICDCDLMWLQYLNGTLYRSENMRCSEPLKLKNRKIMELTANDIPKCFKGGNTKNYERALISMLVILIVVLMFLIVYLINMGPFSRKVYQGRLGPESPYSNISFNVT